MQVNVENSWIVYVIIAGFAFLGVIFSLFGLFLHLKIKKNQRNCITKIPAVVADVMYDSVSGTWHTGDAVGTFSYFPVYEYAINGKIFRKRAFVGTAKPEVQKGDRLFLLINPDNPDEYFCPSEKFKQIKIIFLGIGIGLISLAIILSLIVLFGFKRSISML